MCLICCHITMLMFRLLSTKVSTLFTHILLILLLRQVSPILKFPIFHIQLKTWCLFLLTFAQYSILQRASWIHPAEVFSYPRTPILHLHLIWTGQNSLYAGVWFSRPQMIKNFTSSQTGNVFPEVRKINSCRISIAGQPGTAPGSLDFHHWFQWHSSA